MVASGGSEPILGTFTTGAQVQEYIRKNGVEIVDLRFIDLLGTVQHFSIPSAELSDSMFDWGTGFDGSSIRGFQTIDESDMLVVPDPRAAFMDPTLKHKTMAIMCDIRDPILGR